MNCKNMLKVLIHIKGTNSISKFRILESQIKNSLLFLRGKRKKSYKMQRKKNKQNHSEKRFSEVLFLFTCRGDRTVITLFPSVASICTMIESE